MILYAHDLTRTKRIYIERAQAGAIYFCEGCGSKLAAKNQGKQRRHHFAHIHSEHTSDIQKFCISESLIREDNQMSEWHQAWQEKYPESQREVVIKGAGGFFRRADVCIEKQKKVIEFQHSKITKDVFQSRNAFYTALGYQVLWVFDFDSPAIEGKYSFLDPKKYDDFTKKMLNGARGAQIVYKFDIDLYQSMLGTWKPQGDKTVRIYFMFSDQYRNAQYRKISFVTGNLQKHYPMQFFAYFLSRKEFLKEIGL